MDIQAVAKICHEANHAYCETLFDYTQVSWDEATDLLRNSVKDGVEFHLNNPEAGPDASHANWLKYKRDEGWVVGEVKDAKAKTHPNMVPFDELPIWERRKDILFKAIVDALR